MKNTNRYISYLLRLWRESDSGPWRATLVGQSGQTRSFADPDRLFAFLQAQMTSPAAGDESTRPDDNPLLLQPALSWPASPSKPSTPERERIHSRRSGGRHET